MAVLGQPQPAARGGAIPVACRDGAERGAGARSARTGQRHRGDRNPGIAGNESILSRLVREDTAGAGPLPWIPRDVSAIPDRGAAVLDDADPLCDAGGAR